MKKNSNPKQCNTIPVTSFWELENFYGYDFIIVGAGIVGLSTAATLIERHPNSKVLVLERDLFPTGASTRNAGMACIGSLSELIADRAAFGMHTVHTCVAARYDGLKRLRNRLGDAAIAYEAVGNYELLTNAQTSQLSELAFFNKELRDIVSDNIFIDKSDSLDSYPFSKKVFKYLLFNPHEGLLDSGKLLRALCRYVQKKGVNILTGANVTHCEESNDRVEIHVESPQHSGIHIFNSKAVGICTNAFSSDLFPTLQIVPGRGQVLITEPIAGLSFSGGFHFDSGYYYFRTIENRVLFGGGRNQDLKAEETCEFALNDSIQRDLEEKLRHSLLPKVSLTIDCRWTGIMGFGASKLPTVQALSNSIAAAVGLGGMGVAIGSAIAEQLADVLDGTTTL